MAKNKLKWLDTEYCGNADETIQPVMVGKTLYYTLFDKMGYNYVFPTIYKLHLHLNGAYAQYDFTSEDEYEMIEYLENL